MNKNIYIIGKEVTAYRTIHFLEAMLKDKNRIILNLFEIKFSNRFTLRMKLLCERFIATYNLRKADIVYVSPMCHNNMYEIKRAKSLNKKIITEFYISYYDTLVNDRNIYKKEDKEAKEAYEFDRFALLNSDVVIFLNETEAKRYCSVVDIDISKINYLILPLSIDKKCSVKLKYFKKERKCLNICWWGTYIPLHGLDKIIKSMKLLREENFLCKLYIFGDSDEKAKEYIKLVEENNLDDIIEFNNEFSFNNGKLNEFLTKNCDITLGTFGDSSKAKNVIANKIIDGIALKSPVITGYSAALKEYFQGEDDIFMIENTSEQLAEKIKEVSKKDYDNIKKNIENSYGVYLKTFAPENFKREIVDLVNKI